MDMQGFIKVSYCLKLRQVDMSKLDADGDGQISKEEQPGFCTLRVQGPKE